MLATAPFLRHLIAVPFAFIGLTFILRPQRWAGLFAAQSFTQRQRRLWATDQGATLIRAFGVIFVAVCVYWMVVGTG
jgi:hypothetical protein